MVHRTGRIEAQNVRTGIQTAGAVDEGRKTSLQDGTHTFVVEEAAQFKTRKEGA
jgi:hypothetical protein